MNAFARVLTTSSCLTFALVSAGLEQQNIPAPRPNPAPTQAPGSGSTPERRVGDPAPADDKTVRPENTAAQAAREARAERRYPRLKAGDVDDAMAAWDPRAKEAARAMMAKYGEPNEMTSRRLYWYENGPWLWTCVRSEPVMHNWPRPHAGVIEQAVAFRVAPDRIAEMVKFSGSLLVDRTAGVLISRAGSEEANILAMNMAWQISSGARDSESARRECERLSLSSGEPSPLTERFTFTPAAAGSGDPDREVGAPGGPAATPAAAPVTASPLPIERPRVPNEDKKPK